MNIDRKATFPLLVSANFLYFSPLALPAPRVIFSHDVCPSSAIPSTSGASTSGATETKPDTEQIPLEAAAS